MRTQEGLSSPPVRYQRRAKNRPGSSFPAIPGKHGNVQRDRTRKGVSVMKSLMKWDPFRVLRGFDPVDELRTMQREMDRLFERFLGGETHEEAVRGPWLPAIESYVRDGTLHVKAELPGIEAKDLDVSVSERELVIKGDRRTEKDETKKDYRYREISYGSFERHLTLPEGAKVDELKAAFVNGILEISVPVPALPKAKKVEIDTRGVKQIEPEPKVRKAA